METPEPIVCRSLDEIRRIIAEETWLEGERRGGAVSPHDPVVQERVCRRILRQGRETNGVANLGSAEPAVEFQLIEAAEPFDGGEHHEAA